MGEARHDGLAVPGRVILAHEPPFRIGDLSVHPSTRQIENSGVRETLEPRVMQVLVALARAKGGIVTREELMESCWDGCVVGDDSINRVLSRIRRVAASLGRGGFTIETITKVGYRLNLANAPAQLDGAVEPPSRTAVDRRIFIGGSAAVAALAVAGAATFWPKILVRDKALPEAKSLFDKAVVVRQEDNRQAIAYLREAVRISPEYGEAWGALALSYSHAIENESPDRVSGFQERLQEALRNANRHDPGNADAAIALLPSANSFGRWAELEQIFRNAAQEHPDHAAGHALLGTVLMDVGRWSEAVRALQSATARNDNSAVLRYKLIVSLWAAGQITAAENEIDRAMLLWPQHGAIWQTKIKLLALSGRPKQALAFAQDPTSTPLDEEDAPNQAVRLRFLTALATGSSPDADLAIETMAGHARKVEGDRVSQALYSAALGRIGLALDMLEGVYLRTGEWSVQSPRTNRLSTHPLFQPHARPLWREPRFNRILQTVGLERYWRATGTRPDYRNFM